MSFLGKIRLMKKPLPIGISDFKKVIESGYVYVDKTLLIEELMEQGSEVVLIPRPRRFGKTLNLSMLQYFFEKSDKDASFLFKDLAIWKNEKFRHLQGQFPVIFITFKDLKHTSWQETFSSIQELIASEFRRHRYLLEGTILAEDEKEIYQKILVNKSDQTIIGKSLLLLSEWLHRYHNKRVILLIDEYDTPAHAAYVGAYYELMINFLRNWLSGGLKDNKYLERGVLTGVLRIAKESIFSGLNNISTFTILNEKFKDKFGLLESEVEPLLQSYGLSEKLSTFRDWYDGYQIGSCKGIYNPWSVLKCIEEQGIFFPYWVNTSDNALIKQLITQGKGYFKADIEELLRGGTIDKKLDDGMIFTELEQSTNSIWSLLLFSGYLTLEATPLFGSPCKLKIPNTEVKELYQSMVLNWFEKSLDEQQYHLLFDSLINGDVETFSYIFKEFMISSASIFDIPAEESEKIYHAFVLGLLVGLKGKYEVKSNRESGFGRYNVMLFPKNSHGLGIIIEFKKVDSADPTSLKKAAESALEQIENKQYAQELIDRGVQRILYLGLSFKGKAVYIAHLFKESFSL